MPQAGNLRHPHYPRACLKIHSRHLRALMVLSSSVNAGHTLHSSYRTPGWVQHLPTVRTSHLRPSLCDVQSRLLFPFHVISMNWSFLYVRMILRQFSDFVNHRIAI